MSRETFKKGWENEPICRKIKPRSLDNLLVQWFSHGFKKFKKGNYKHQVGKILFPKDQNR
jgi:hypothetical protein